MNGLKKHNKGKMEQEIFWKKFKVEKFRALRAIKEY